MLALALGSAAVSCTFNPSGQVGGPDSSIEPPPDADPLRPDAAPLAPDARAGAPDARVPPDPPGDCESWTPAPTYFNPCDLPLPSAALNLSMSGEYVYNTDTVTLRDPAGTVIAHASQELSGNPPVVVISVESLLVGNTARLRVVGGKPLLVASWSEITVEGLIDASSDLSRSGAGANPGSCVPSGSGGQNNNGGGGGGGGGFGGEGGRGGTGEGGGGGGNPGGSVAKPTVLRGGCAGAGGGLGLDGASAGGGAGGAGGGALQLTAQDLIRITGRLHAGGSGGGGADGSAGRRGGGGGGGSGGLIDLEAPAISFGPGAVVAANGGGGGEGTEGETADPGLTGRIDDTPAEGGSGNSATGGNGGDGSAGNERDGAIGGVGTRDSADRGGGGGGGGGAGYIIIDGTETVPPGAVLSPQPVDR
jgi:hypothetical protein